MKIISFYKSLRRISSRHRRSLPIAIVYEAFIRCYRLSIFRNIVKNIFTNKKPKGWIFVGGCYNSGTTIIKDIIALHSDVNCCPIEGDLLTDELSNFEEGGWHRGMFGNAEAIEINRSMSSVNSINIINDWSPWIRQDAYFMDKAISHTVRVSALRDSFPGSKFIIVVRNSIDVASGIKKRSRPSGLAAEKLNSTQYSEEYLMEQWKFMYAKVIEDYSQDDVLLVPYENVIENPVLWTEKIYHFLELSMPTVTLESETLFVEGMSIYIRSAGKESTADIQTFSQLCSFIRPRNQSKV